MRSHQPGQAICARTKWIFPRGKLDEAEFPSDHFTFRDVSRASADIMAARPLVNDALWRCLCPSFNSFKRVESIRRCSPARHAPRPLGGLDGRIQPSYGRSMSMRSTACVANALGTESVSQPESMVRTIPDAVPRPHPNRNNKWENPALVLLPTAELYERLRSDAATGRHEEVFNIIKILIKDRRERPNIRLYAAMLHSFVSPEYGTAGKIRKMLEEMAELGVDLDAGACHAVLEV